MLLGNEMYTKTSHIVKNRKKTSFFSVLFPNSKTVEFENKQKR